MQLQPCVRGGSSVLIELDSLLRPALRSLQRLVSCGRLFSSEADGARQASNHRQSVHHDLRLKLPISMCASGRAVSLDLLAECLFRGYKHGPTIP